MPGHHGGPSISGSKPKPKPSKPSSSSGFFGSMYTSPGSSTQQQGPPNLSSVGFNEGQVDPGLASGVMQAGGMSAQQANQIAQETMGNTGQGFGITGTGNFGTQDTSGSGQGTDTSSSETSSSETKSPLDKFNNFMAFGKPIKDLKDNDLKLILEQVKLYQDGMPNYFQGIPGGFNFVKGIFNSMGQGLERSGEFGGVEGSPTLEGLEKIIRDLDPDSNMLDSFKQADPAAYLDTFGLPQTDAGLDFFANLSLDDDTVDKYTQQKIIEARERLNDKTKLRRQEKYPEGIQNLQPGKIIQDDGFGDVVLGYGPMDRMGYTAVMPREGYQYSYDQQGRRYEIPIGGNQSGTTYGGNPFTFREGGPNIPPQAIGDKFKTGIPSLAPTSIDYASMGPQYGGYVNQGISDPRFASYFQNLQMFPRRS